MSKTVAGKMYDYYNDIRNPINVNLLVNKLDRETVLQILAVIIELEKLTSQDKDKDSA